MGWKEARTRYADGSTLAGQPVEDLVARRVLAGIEIRQTELPRVERALGIEPDFDIALWPRVLALLQNGITPKAMSTRMIGTAEHPGMYSVDVIQVSPDHKEIKATLELLALHKARPHPLTLSRVKGSTISLAYFPMSRDVEHGAYDLSPMSEWLKAPFNVIAETDRWWLAYQETTHFFKQFGPYTGPINR